MWTIVPLAAHRQEDQIVGTREVTDMVIISPWQARLVKKSTKPNVLLAYLVRGSVVMLNLLAASTLEVGACWGVYRLSMTYSSR